MSDNRRKIGTIKLLITSSSPLTIISKDLWLSTFFSQNANEDLLVIFFTLNEDEYAKVISHSVLPPTEEFDINNVPFKCRYKNIRDKAYYKIYTVLRAENLEKKVQMLKNNPNPFIKFKFRDAEEKYWDLVIGKI